MGVSRDGMGRKADSVKREAMEWMLDNLHYYCPVTDDGRDKLAEFAVKMEEGDWHGAEKAYKAVTGDFCNDIGLFMYGSRDGKGIVSRHTDAYLISGVLGVTDLKLPVGFCRGRKGVDREKIYLEHRSGQFKNITNEIAADNIKIHIKSYIIRVLVFLLFIAGVSIFVYAGGCERNSGAAVLSVLLVLAAYIFLAVSFGRIAGELHIRQKKEYWKSYLEGIALVGRTDICGGNCMMTQKMPEDVHNELKERTDRTVKKYFGRRRIIPKIIREICFTNKLFILCTVCFIAVLFMKIYPLRAGSERGIQPEGKEAGEEKVMQPKVEVMGAGGMELVSERKEVSVSEDMQGKRGIEKGESVPDAEREEEAPENVPQADSFASEGVIFTDSNSRKLKREEIEALRGRSDMDYQTALGYARNEIYARMGYPFSREGGKYSEHYSKYPWYAEIKKREITEDMFNEYERANIDLILEIERELGITESRPGE